MGDPLTDDDLPDELPEGYADDDLPDDYFDEVYGVPKANDASPATDAPKASDTAQEKPKRDESKARANVDDSHSKKPDVAADDASVAASGKTKEKGFVLLRGDAPELANLLIKRIAKWYGGHFPVFTEDGFWVYCPEKRRPSDRVGAYVPIPEEKMHAAVASYAGCMVKTSEEDKPLRLSHSNITGAVKLASDLCAAKSFFAGKRYVHQDKGDSLFRGWEEAGDEFNGEAVGGCLFSDWYVRATAQKLEVLLHSHEHKARVGYDFSLEGDKYPLKFIAWLWDNFDGYEDRAEIVELLQELLGAAILGMGPKFQMWLVLFGEGNNGKSVLMKVCEMIAPLGTVCSMPPQRFDKEHNLAELAGKRLNILEELPEQEILESGQIKNIVGGGKVTAARKYGQPFDFISTLTILCATNALPPVRDMTHGFWRRLIVLPMTKVYPDGIVKRGYEETFRDEIPKIVRWAIEGYRRLVQRQAYAIPASCKLAVDEWQKETDHVRAWLDDIGLLPGEDKCRVGYRERYEFVTDLYENFKKWCMDRGNKQSAAMAQNTFAKRLAKVNGWKAAVVPRQTDESDGKKKAVYKCNWPLPVSSSPAVM